MSKFAYLVGFLDTKQDPPKFVGADVFSESSPTIHYFPFVILKVEADTFSKAVEHMLSFAEEFPGHEWCVPYILESRAAQSIRLNRRKEE